MTEGSGPSAVHLRTASEALHRKSDTTGQDGDQSVNRAFLFSFFFWAFHRRWKLKQRTKTDRSTQTHTAACPCPGQRLKAGRVGGGDQTNRLPALPFGTGGHLSGGVGVLFSPKLQDFQLPLRGGGGGGGGGLRGRGI